MLKDKAINGYIKYQIFKYRLTNKVLPSNKKGQAVLEYTAIFAICVLGLALTMDIIQERIGRRALRTMYNICVTDAGGDTWKQCRIK